MSNEILNNLLKEYDQKKTKAEIDLINRKEKLYESIPRLKEIEDELNKSAFETTKNILNIKEKSIEFINNFDNPDYKNLLFTGNSGLRKNLYV